MMTIRKSNDRGRGRHGWLDSWHTFSFAGHYDPEHMGFRSLRVINEDFIEPGEGFGKHGHRDMEIITYMLDGALAHEDSAGNRATLRPGMVQYMSAGSGIEHSEFNGSDAERAHLLQIWIVPAEKGAEPRYINRDFSGELGEGGLVPIAAPGGDDGALPIRQDARVYAARPRAGGVIEREIADGRAAWVQAARGTLNVNGERLEAGDAAAVTDERALRIEAESGAEFLLFDLK